MTGRKRRSVATVRTEIYSALMLAWRALLDGADPTRVVPAATAAQERYPCKAGDRSAEWYATAINHYLASPEGMQS